MAIYSLINQQKWKLSAILALFSAQNINAATGPTGSFAPGSGFVWSTSVVGSWTGTTSPTLGLPSADPWGGMITDNFLSTINVCMNPALFGTSSDGVFSGLVLAPDVILGMSSGTIQGEYWVSNINNGTHVTYTSSGSWSSNGNLVTSSLTTTPWCLGTQQHSLGPGYGAVRTSSHRGTMSGVMSLYIGPLAPLGNINSPRLGHSARSRSSTPPVTQLIPASQFTITLPTDCTVGFQDNNVSFGAVTHLQADKQILATYSSQLTIQCNTINDGGSGTGQTTLQLAFSGSLGRNTDTLALNNTNAETLAEIRGILAAESGDCTTTHNEQILFNNQPTNIANVAEGSTEIPLTWTLCSNSLRHYGGGTAQAIATLSWP
ncbi:hypothetical protein [Serratia microhaemolytica]|uniref:hypothetical protein n=1 Tax=Serratia microhaemolytica TaxID=2675110 RepID=UPI000FDE89F7|nr:hypothetical protein [Serratia microhaemolytica]